MFFLFGSTLSYSVSMSVISFLSRIAGVNTANIFPQYFFFFFFLSVVIVPGIFLY